MKFIFDHQGAAAWPGLQKMSLSVSSRASLLNFKVCGTHKKQKASIKAHAPL
jgi:hypothetical protein